MFRNVKLDHGIFTAKDEMKRKVTIHESISFIFKVEVAEETPNKVLYRAIDYRSPEILLEIEKYLKGVDYDQVLLETIVIRYGWMDKRLNKLSFVPIADVLTLIRTKKATKTDERKLTAICKQLSLSMKQVLK